MIHLSRTPCPRQAVALKVLLPAPSFLYVKDYSIHSSNPASHRPSISSLLFPPPRFSPSRPQTPLPPQIFLLLGHNPLPRRSLPPSGQLGPSKSIAGTPQPGTERTAIAFEFAVAHQPCTRWCCSILRKAASASCIPYWYHTPLCFSTAHRIAGTWCHS